MIRIVVSAEAYAAIVDGRPECNLLPPQGSPETGFDLWLDKMTLNRLEASRGPGESYSDAILRLAEA